LGENFDGEGVVPDTVVDDNAVRLEIALREIETLIYG
jgi:hypothetical protein